MLNAPLRLTGLAVGLGSEMSPNPAIGEILAPRLLKSKSNLGSPSFHPALARIRQVQYVVWILLLCSMFVNKTYSTSANKFKTTSF